MARSIPKAKGSRYDSNHPTRMVPSAGWVPRFGAQIATSFPFRTIMNGGWSTQYRNPKLMA